jgi:hypothetical protein
MAANDAGEYEEFARRAMPTLTRAFITTRGQDAPEAAAEALAYAWEHWDRVCELRNRSDSSIASASRAPGDDGRQCSQRPRQSAYRTSNRASCQNYNDFPRHSGRRCGWSTHASGVAAALGTTTSMVGNHVSRGLTRLRQALEVVRA